MGKYIILGILILLIIYVLIVYNSLIELNNKVKEAFSTMDVYLKKRWDIIPNIVEVVKGYTKHEKDTLKEVIELRSGSYDNMSTTEKLKTNEKISKSISSIFAVVENYPELKSNENFEKLMDELTHVEEDIANSRKYYNGVVRIYNNKVEMFPSNILASLFGYKTKTMFEASEKEKNNVDVDL